MRVGKKPLRRIALFGALCLPILPALAQEGGSVLYRFGIDQDFQLGRNIELDVPEAGTSSFADTNLSFGILSEREDQALDLDMGLSLTVEDTPETAGTTEVSLDNPFLDLAYDRLGANSSFSIDLNYDESSIDRLNLSDFVNADGELVLPEDFSSLTGTGNRSDYNADLLLRLGTSAPFGFNLSAGVSGTNYTDITDNSLFDYDRTNLGGQARFRFSEVLTGTLGLDYFTYDADDPEQTYRTTTEEYVGIEYAISSRASLSASVGASQISTEEFGANSTDINNPIWNVSFVYDMPNGEVTADLDLSSDDDGNQRRNLIVGRSMALPDGALSYSLGVTDPEFGSAEPVGSLNWRRNLPSGRIGISLGRSVSNTNTDETQLSTRAAITYDHDINAVSAVGLELFYGLTDGTETSNGVTQTEISANYRYALTDDWNLRTGISYQVRDEDTVGRADSPSVFLSIGRRFDFRP